MNTWLLLSIIIGILIILIGIINIIYANKAFLKLREKYKLIHTESGIDTTDLLDYSVQCDFIDNTDITLIETENSNGYYSKKKILSLSEDVLGSDDIYSLACTAHEIGHIKEQQLGKMIVNLTYRLSILESITSKIILPLFISGLILSFFGSWATYLGIIFMNLSTIFTICAILGRLVLVKAESNASRQAVKLLESTQALTKNEMSKIQKMLKAALLTYVNGFFDRFLLNFKTAGKAICNLWHKKL